MCAYSVSLGTLDLETFVNEEPGDCRLFSCCATRSLNLCVGIVNVLCGDEPRRLGVNSLEFLRANNAKFSTLSG